MFHLSFVYCFLNILISIRFILFYFILLRYEQNATRNYIFFFFYKNRTCEYSKGKRINWFTLYDFVLETTRGEANFFRSNRLNLSEWWYSFNAFRNQRWSTRWIVETGIANQTRLAAVIDNYESGRESYNVTHIITFDLWVTIFESALTSLNSSSPRKD